MMADVQIRVEGSLCEVDPDDVVSDLVSRDGSVSAHFCFSLYLYMSLSPLSFFGDIFTLSSVSLLFLCIQI